MTPVLSLAIPSYKRAAELAATLNAFLPQIEPFGIPVCISYTDDTDATARVIEAFRERYPLVTAVSDPRATNIDRKMVSVVALARTQYVWLFGDDDIPEPGVIALLMRLFAEREWGLIVLNGSTHDSQFASVVEERRIRAREDRIYGPGEHEALLGDTAGYATFLGGLVFDKAVWDSVDPVPYFDTDYAHVATLYRGIVGRYARLVAEPQLRIRLGTATWANRYFEIELIHWPQTIWGLPGDDYSDAAKAVVCGRNPLASVARLLATRAYGFYKHEQYLKYIAPDSSLSPWRKAMLRLPLFVSERLAARFLAAYRRIQSLWGDPNLELSLYRLRNR